MVVLTGVCPRLSSSSRFRRSENIFYFFRRYIGADAVFPASDPRSPSTDFQ